MSTTNENGGWLLAGLTSLNGLIPSWINRDQTRLKPGKPPSNLSDFTYLLDSDGGGGLCFQTLYEQEQPPQDKPKQK